MAAIAWLTSPFALVTAGGFGAVWGSFFNVCIARIPRGVSVVRPPSHCLACGQGVRPYDNIPILSYLLLRGRCRSCGARFSPRYLLVEALSAALSALVFWTFVTAAAPEVPLGVRAARYAVYFALAGVLIVLSFIDLDTKRLPDVITLPAIPVLFLAAFGAQDVAWQSRAIGAAGGYLFVRLVSDGYYYLRGREGLGLGDGKLLAVIGAALGWRAVAVAIFMGSFLGVFVSVPLLLARRRGVGAAEGKPAQVRYAEVPFGPFLSLGAIIYLLFRDALWNSALSLLGDWA